MKIINYTDLRLNLKKWLDTVADDMEEIVVTRKDNKNLVLITLEEYNSLKETHYLLSGKNKEVLLESIEQLRTNQTVKKDLLDS